MKYAVYVVAIGFLISCSGESEDVSNHDTELNVDTTLMDTIPAIDSSIFDGVVYTANAAVDGPDDELWVFQPGAWDGEVISPFDPTAEVLHVIPMGDDDESIHEEMSYANKMDFTLYGPFEDFSGPVIFFYDRSKQKMAAQFFVEGGKPEGMASVYERDGSIFIQRRYEAGEWVESFVEPHSVDWKFSQGESRLWVEDLMTPQDVADGLVTIGPSVNAENQTDNFLFKILEKDSYANPFVINGQVYSGKLFGYHEPSGISYESLNFELNFQEGWLHGDVKIYSDWFGLELHEVFEMGELDTTVFVLNTEDMDGLAKPIIYLYPEEKTPVSVKLDLKGELTHSYPKYQDGWKVLANPDGTLLDAEQKEYYALYWEGNNSQSFDVKDGFVVPSDETAAFLEESLAILGLNRREANEFIVFWLPVLERNPYNLIHFASDQYEEMAELTIEPKPETVIRVMMVYRPLSEPIDIPLQDLNKLRKDRKGFTVVEWGGSLYKSPL